MWSDKVNLIVSHGCSLDINVYSERLSKKLCLDDDVVVLIWQWLNIVVNDERNILRTTYFLNNSFVSSSNSHCQPAYV